MARAYVVAQQAVDAGSDDPFYRDKQRTAVYYVQHVLPQAMSCHARIVAGGTMLTGDDDDWFDSAY